MKFTKGDWKAYFGYDGQFDYEPRILVTLDSPPYIGWRADQCVAIVRYITQKETNANAHLIAAAPTFYQALKDIVERHEQGLALGETLELEPAREALAKAEEED